MDQVLSFPVPNEKQWEQILERPFGKVQTQILRLMRKKNPISATDLEAAGLLPYYAINQGISQRFSRSGLPFRMYVFGRSSHEGGDFSTDYMYYLCVPPPWAASPCPFDPDLEKMVSYDLRKEVMRLRGLIQQHREGKITNRELYGAVPKKVNK